MTKDGSILYLDVQRIERSRRRGAMVTSVVATLGDGPYEGEILVELGDRTEVIFVDEWLGGSDVGNFLDRIDRPRVEKALGEALRAAPVESPMPACCPHHGGAAEGEIAHGVAEAAAEWRCAAA
jgi:hypothetical protein